MVTYLLDPFKESASAVQNWRHDTPLDKVGGCILGLRTGRSVKTSFQCNGNPQSGLGYWGEYSVYKRVCWSTNWYCGNSLCPEGVVGPEGGVGGDGKRR